MDYARAAFGNIATITKSPNIIGIMQELEKEGFTNVTLVVGSDRVGEFDKLLKTYNKKEFNFDKINVVSAGERDPDAEDVSGMSASKMRAFAKDKNMAGFVSGAPEKMSDIIKRKMYQDVSQAMAEGIMSLNKEFTKHIINEEFNDLAEALWSKKIGAEGDEGDRNIIYQLRKVINLKGLYSVVWADGTKSKVSVDDAKSALDTYDKIMGPGISGRDKQLFVKRLGKNEKTFKYTLGEQDDKQGLLTPQVDMLLRLGLADANTINRYRQALKGGEKSLANPDLRLKILDLLDKLLALTKDPQIFGRIRQSLAHKEGVLDKHDDDDKQTLLTPKVDMLLRLGLVDANTINRYRQALKGGEKSLANPDLRQRLLDLLDKLLTLSTKDVQIYSRLRQTLVRQEATQDSPERRAELALRKRQDSEQDAMAIKHAKEKASARVAVIQAKQLADETNITDSLKGKAAKSGFSFNIIKEIYDRGLASWGTTNNTQNQQQWAFARVNSFIADGLARKLDSDLVETAKMSSGEKLRRAVDRLRVANGEEPRSKSEPTKFVKMKRAGALSPIMNVPSDEVDEFKKKGWAIEETSGAGEDGTDELRKKYCADTPGQIETLNIASYSIPKPEIDMPMSKESIKSPRTFLEIRKILSGYQERKELK